MVENKANQLINVNTCDLATLKTLPGVGESTARRIMAGRPYTSVKDLEEVAGLGKKSLEGILPLIHVGTDQEEQAGKTQGDEDRLSWIERTNVAASTVVNRMETSAEAFSESMSVPRQVVWFVFLSSGLSVVLSVVLTLILLAGINRTLNFNRHPAVRELRADLSQMDGSLDSLTAELASVDQRLLAVEGLSGRMATLESEFDLIREDVGQAVSLVDQMSIEVETMSVEVDAMVEKVDLFDGFLEGMRILVSDLFTIDESPPSP